MQGARVRRRWLFVVLVVVLLLVVAWLAIGHVAADRLTLPRREFDAANHPGVHGASYEDLRLRASDGTELTAWFLPVPGAQAGVVLVHGKDSSRSRELDGGFPEVAATLQANGYQVVMVELRGHGDSGDGRFSFGRFERLDVRAAIDHLQAHGVPSGGVGLLGVSMGAASAVGAAADDPRVGALWADAGYAEILPLIRAEWPATSGLPLPFWTAARLMFRLRFGFDVASSKPVEDIARLGAMPVQLVHGTHDRLVPYAHALALHAAAPGADLWSLPGVGHADAYTAETAIYSQRVVEFFDAALRTMEAGR